MAWYYTFTPPEAIGGGTKHKPGITNSFPDGRLGKYQLPYGPCWEASYSWLCYHEDINVIKWIEASVLGHFRHQAYGIGASLSCRIGKSSIRMSSTELPVLWQLLRDGSKHGWGEKMGA